MFFIIYKYNFKMILRDKVTVFWVLCWSIILATLYSLCFSNLLAGEKFESIDIAIVENKDIPDDFYKAIDESNMFIVTKTDENSAIDLLSKGKVKAYLTYNDEFEIVVNKSGMDESIVKIFTDTYSQTCSTINNIIKDNPSVLASGFLSDLGLDKSYITDKPVGKTTNIVVIYFYSLLAMTCLLGTTLGTDVISKIQANQTYVAARINVAPTHKFKAFFASMCASMTFHFISILLTLLYMVLVLKVEFGGSIGYILLICFAGSFAGFAFGSFTSVIITKNDTIKVAVDLAFTLFGCFLSGMMVVDMKYIIESKFPFVAYINPASMITDGLYSLYYYTSLDRYFTNVLLLVAFGCVFNFLTYLILRRKKYASI